MSSRPEASGRTLIAYRVRNFAAGGGAAGRAAVRRLRRGPTLPSWTWSEELFVAAFRGATTSAARHIELMSVGAGRRATPIARRDRSALDVTMVDLLGIRAERYSPKTTAAGTILRFHGGGFASGSAATERRVAAQLAALTSCDTYGITYRLAPQHPYPAALDDAVTAYRALLTRGTDPTRTILFGGSAGAGLALGTLLRVRHEGLPMPAGAVLLWPYADFTFSGESISTNATVDMLPLRDLAGICGPAYVGDADPTDRPVRVSRARRSTWPAAAADRGGRRRVPAVIGRADRRQRTRCGCRGGAEHLPREGARLDDPAAPSSHGPGHPGDHHLDRDPARADNDLGPRVHEHPRQLNGRAEALSTQHSQRRWPGAGRQVREGLRAMLHTWRSAR